ncbi:MAG: helix-turn-helix domain-containing protein [Cycloclasticus sp.]|nr:helix-turn-helix domain-containing protein [Cycloclasticus sp.]
MNSDCENCTLSYRCVPSAISSKELFRFTNIVSTNELYQPHDKLFEQSTKADHLYVVKSGSFKTSIQGSTNNPHVNGFFLPGELIGMESMAGNNYLSSSTAIESSLACKINYRQLGALRKDFPLLSDLSVKLYSQALALSQSILSCVSKQSAAQRLACFILILMERTKQLNRRVSEVYLNMSRQDIASHLGLAVETVSRSFSKLIKHGYIKKNNRHIYITDSKQLQFFSTH